MHFSGVSAPAYIKYQDSAPGNQQQRSGNHTLSIKFWRIRRSKIINPYEARTQRGRRSEDKCKVTNQFQEENDHSNNEEEWKFAWITEGTVVLNNMRLAKAEIGMSAYLKVRNHQVSK